MYTNPLTEVQSDTEQTGKPPNDLPPGSAQIDMREITLKPWPSDPLPPRLNEEQQLALAAYNLENQYEETRDKIRLFHLCAAHYASPTPPLQHPAPHSQSSRPPPTFREAARSIPKPDAPIPTVRTTRKPQPPVFHIQEDNTKLAIAKREIRCLEEYEIANRGLIEALKAAREGGDRDGDGDVRMGGVGDEGGGGVGGRRRSSGGGDRGDGGDGMRIRGTAREQGQSSAEPSKDPRLVGRNRR
ncbi:hypothetical protein ACLMJK_002113 [Lecanora helva]